MAGVTLVESPFVAPTDRALSSVSTASAAARVAMAANCTAKAERGADASVTAAIALNAGAALG